MWLSQITLQQFRNIETLHLSACHPQFNLLWGKNGAGKTSVLEALTVLSTGKSFRTAHTNELIRGEAEAFLIRASLESIDERPIKLGMQRDRQGSLDMRLQDAIPRSVVEIAKCLPLQTLNAQSFALLEGAPQLRRQFLDQAMFHVEPSYHQWWHKYRRILKQRNVYLKAQQKLNLDVLQAWDLELAKLGELLELSRQAYLERWFPCLKQVLKAWLPEPQLELHYHQGWRKGQGLFEALAESHKRDKILGYTTRGPHRAEFEFMSSLGPAKDYLSRGQTKRVVAAMLIGRHLQVRDKTGRSSVFLIDDLPAEIDNEGVCEILNTIKSLGVQCFITAIESASLEAPLYQEERMEYHLQDGRLQALT